jgi:hypothetical protein
LKRRGPAFAVQRTFFPTIFCLRNFPPGVTEHFQVLSSKMRWLPLCLAAVLLSQVACAHAISLTSVPPATTYLSSTITLNGNFFPTTGGCAATRASEGTASDFLMCTLDNDSNVFFRMELHAAAAAGIYKFIVTLSTFGALTSESSTLVDNYNPNLIITSPAESCVNSTIAVTVPAGVAAAGGNVNVITSADTTDSTHVASGVIGVTVTAVLFTTASAAAADRVAAPTSVPAMLTGGFMTMNYPINFFATNFAPTEAVSGGALLAPLGRIATPAASSIVAPTAGTTLAASTSVTVTLMGLTMGGATAGSASGITISTRAGLAPSVGIASGAIGGQVTGATFAIASGDRKKGAAATFELALNQNQNQHQSLLQALQDKSSPPRCKNQGLSKCSAAFELNSSTMCKFNVRSTLHPAIVSEFITNTTIWAIMDACGQLQSQVADWRMRILVAAFLVFVSVVATFWKYLITRRLWGAWWLPATIFYSQFPSLAQATAKFISISNFVVHPPIIFCRLSRSCNLRHTLSAFVKIKSFSSFSHAISAT